MLPAMNILKKLIKLFSPEDFIFYRQNRDMSDQEKVGFLEHFMGHPIVTTVGFLVIGGSFAEGINLIDDRLIGAVIIGIGMPRINF